MILFMGFQSVQRRQDESNLCDAKCLWFLCAVSTGSTYAVVLWWNICLFVLFVPVFLRDRGLPAAEGRSWSEEETEQIQRGGAAGGAGAAGGHLPAVPHLQLWGRRERVPGGGQQSADRWPIRTALDIRLKKREDPPTFTCHFLLAPSD